MYNSHSLVVDVLVNEKPVRQIYHNGRLYIEAREGSEFEIRVRNNSYLRRLAVIAIDSLNIVDGKVNSTAGYVLNSYNSYTAKGFRTNNDNVNAFKFARKNKSYAAKSDETNGNTSNCGVIGVRLYNEYQEPTYNFSNFYSEPEPIIGYDYNTASTDASTFSRKGLVGTPLRNYQPTFTCSTNQETTRSLNTTTKINFDLGTEFSKKEITDKVKNVEFKIGTLSETIEIFYASRQALLDMSVPLEKENAVSFPQSFPGFCKPPRD